MKRPEIVVTRDDNRKNFFLTACIAAVVSCLAPVASAYAQTPPTPPPLPATTAGDLLDRGGKRLSEAEMKQLISGATISGRQGGNFPDVTFTIVYGADGKANGNAWRSGSWFSKMRGTWSIDASGRLCSDLLNDRQEKVAGCGAFYALGNIYYAVRGDDRTAEANWRSVSR